MPSTKEMQAAVMRVPVEGGVRLSFDHMSLKLDTAEDAAAVVNRIMDAPDLEELCLSGNTIGAEAAKAIAGALAQRPSFKRAMWADMFTGRLRAEIPQALRALGEAIVSSGAKLESLDLSDNAFGPDGVEAVRDLLVSPAGYSIQRLRFHNNGLGPGGGKILSEALLKCHENAAAASEVFAPKSIVVNRNRLRDEGATCLAKAYKTIGSLRVLSMFENSINAPGIIALADAFQSNRELEDIDLCDNTFTVAGGVAMAKVLPSLTNLQAINFDDCLIRNEGFLAMADAFTRSCPKLKKVSLGYNEADGASGIAVAQALVQKPHVNWVNLNGNNFGAEAVDSIQQIFPGDMLQSLSEDDEDPSGSDGEDGENNDEGADSEDDASEPLDNVSLSSVDTQLERLCFPTEQLSVSEARTVLQAPSGAKVCQLGRQLDTLRQAVDVIQNDTRQVAIAFAEACNVVRQGEAQAKAAEAFVDCVLSSFLSQSGVSGDDLVSEILVQTGLLKSEDKAVPRISDMRGLMQLLRHTVMQSYFPKPSASILAAFMTKPNKLLSIDVQEDRTYLLQVLYTM